jgi:hypothetical protein
VTLPAIFCHNIGNGEWNEVMRRALQARERLHALYILLQFIYFGSREMRELLRLDPTTAVFDVSLAAHRRPSAVELYPNYCCCALKGAIAHRLIEIELARATKKRRVCQVLRSRNFSRGFVRQTERS